MFLNTRDVRLEISVGSTHVNLNGMSVYVKTWKIKKNRAVHCFGLTELNKTMGQNIDSR